ncbi:MAG TPA: adhesin, partial [Methyloradius sp.]
DADKVAKEIQAQVQITEAFSQQAYQAVGNYVQKARESLHEQLRNATSEEEKVSIQTKLDELLLQERVMNVLIGTVTGIGGAALTKEGLSVAADQMRKLMIKDSEKFAGVVDANGNTLDNIAAESDGVRGDGKKIGGTRVDLDLLCGVDNSRCAVNSDGSFDLKDGKIQFIAKDEQGNLTSLADFINTPEGQKMVGPTGGIQGFKGTLFGIPYEAGSWQDKLIESFSGTHDFIGGSLSGLYDENGNIKRGMSDTERAIYNNLITTTAIPVAAPFATAELLPPELWQAISILLKGAR